MERSVHISGSIVLYKNDEELLKKAINSFLDTSLDVKLYLVDNSPTDKLRYLSGTDKRVVYVFNGVNLGFGKAHNVAMRRSIEEGVAYHLVLNPDVYFSQGVLEELFEYMELNADVANVVPKVYYPDGSLQYVCRLLPTPIDLLVRRFIPFSWIRDRIDRDFELRDLDYDKILNIPFFIGCFLFLRVKCLRDIGLFDENIFMYMEDVDLNRRLHSKYKTVFYPYVNIVHIHARESYRRKALLLAHIKSTIYYFNKYGWFFDKFRRETNKQFAKK